jgi:ubiquinone/menaquinone biosynthesis C-methylase UbiE
LDTGAELLEIGTGPGNLGCEVAAAAAEPRMHGLDISERMLSLALAKDVYQSVARAGADRIPFAPEAFDGVYSAFVLHSVFNQERTFRELWRVLRPGRRAVLIDLYPSRGSAGRALFTGFFHALRREFGAPALYRPVEHYVRFALETGFEVCSVQLLGETRSYNHFLMTVHKLR